MIQITLPDNSRREFPGPVSVAEVAQSIGPGLAKVCRFRDEARAFNFASHDLRESKSAEQQTLQFICGPPHANHQDALGVDACRCQNLDGGLGFA